MCWLLKAHKIRKEMQEIEMDMIHSEKILKTVDVSLYGVCVKIYAKNAESIGCIQEVCKNTF